jgi:phosphoglycolate phosphatase-like HAD superfamily hydrolase
VGAEAVGVLWGYGDAEELEAAGAHRLLSRPAELVHAFAG